MRLVFSISIVILGILSCDSDKNIKGTWISAYTIGVDSIPEDPIRYLVIKMSDEELTIKTIGTPPFSESPFDTTIVGERKINSLLLKIWDNPKIKLTKDSLVFPGPNIHTGSGVYPTYQIFKKFPKKEKRTLWNPNGNSYKFESNGVTYYEEFVNDSTLVIRNETTNEVFVQNWGIEYFENHSFLTIEDFYNTTPFFIDSIRGENTYVSRIFNEKMRFIYEKQSTKKHPKLLGKWQLISKQASPPFIPENLRMVELEFKKDSVQIVNLGKTIVKKWTIDGSGKLIFFPNEPINKYSIWSILELSENELIIKANPLQARTFQNGKILKYSKK